MKTSFIRIVLTSLLAGLFIASVAMASAGSVGYLRVSASEKTKVNPDSPPTKVEKPRENETAKPEGSGDTVSREAECRAAAGMTTVADGGDDSEATVADGAADTAQKKGLDRPIEVVLANCIKNPQAPGLVNALRHLVENRERHMAHAAERAQRRTERVAKKAARPIVSVSHGKGHGKGHGKKSE